MNNIIVTGRIVADINDPNNTRPLYGKMNGTDRSFYNNRIGVNDGYFDKNNQWVDRSYFFNIRAYQGVADNLAKNYIKGDPVLIQGKLVAETYQTQDGKQGTNTYIEVSKVERSSPVNPHKQQATGQAAAQPMQYGQAPQDLPFGNPMQAGQAPMQTGNTQPMQTAQPPQNAVEDFANIGEGMPFL